MAKISKKFVQLGLRRDKNLSDVGDPTAALNNLLNNIETDSTKSFISEDLDAIRGLRNRSILPEKLYDLSGATQKYSKQTTVGQVVTIEEVEVTPFVTLKDRVDNAKTITGNIPAYLGGLGLTARFIPSTDINSASSSSTGSTIFDFNSSQIEEVFWEVGRFSFSATIDSSFPDQYGGIQWEGYFSPSLKDPNVNIYFSTTGLVIFEYDKNDDGNWTTLKSIYADSRTLQVSTTSSLTTITLQPDTTKYISAGDFVGTLDSGITVLSITDSSTIEVSANYPVTSGNSITFIKKLGDTNTSNNVRLPTVEPGKQIRIRISYWYPNLAGVDVPDKSIYFSYIGSELVFPNLYAEKPSSTLGEFEIRQFLIDAVTPYQTNVGVSGDNKNLYINNSFVSSYVPKSGFSEIKNYGPVSISVSLNDNILVSPSSLSNVEIGNFIVPVSTTTQITSFIQVKDYISDTTKISTANFTQTESISVNFIDHKGFIGWYVAQSVGTTVNLNISTSELKVGYVVITANTTPGTFFHITSLASGSVNTFVTNAPISLTGYEIIYIYGDKGLIDFSKDVFCNGVFGKVLTTSVSSGNTMILSNVTGVTLGQVVQYGNLIPANTTVTTINSGTNTITLSNSISSAIDASSTIVFAPSGTLLNKEACVIPLDTSPPFIGTSVGLSTNGKGINSAPSVASFAVNVNNLTANIPSLHITTASIAQQFDRKIRINSIYSILSKSS